MTVTTGHAERTRVMTREAASELCGQMVPEVGGHWQHDPIVITDPDLGEPVIAYLPLPDATVDALRWATTTLPRAVWSSVGRAEKLRARAATFGMTPRRPTLKRDSCRVSRLSREAPEHHEVFASTALLLGDMLTAISPEIAARDTLTIAEIDEEWRMAPGAAWTSGVINLTAQLPYHRDKQNFDAWAAMPVVRSGVSGGGLHIPEYGLTLSCRDGYAVFFNGYRLVHGVTPLTSIRPQRNGRPRGYRYSVVYYALRGMKDCATFAAELAQGQARRTVREEHQRDFVRGQKPDWDTH